MYVLVLLSPTGERKKELPLAADRVSIGADGANTIVVPKADVAPRHCALERAADGGYKLVDLHTDHGTQVNGSYVVQRKLEPGDTISFAGVTLVFERHAAPPIDAAALATAFAVHDEFDSAAPFAAPEEEHVEAPEHAVIDDPETLASKSPPRPPRKGTPVRVRVAWAAVIVAAFWIASYAINQWKSPEGGTPTLEAVVAEHVAILLRAAQFDEATVLLDRDVADGTIAQSAANPLRQNVEQARSRAQFAREDLDRLRSDPTLTNERRVELLEELQSRWRDVPQMQAEVAVQRRLAEDTLAAETNVSNLPRIQEIADFADIAMKAHEYAPAVGAWRSLEQSPFATDVAAATAGRKSIEDAAKVSADALIGRVDELMAKDDMLRALEALGPRELAAYRGTNAFDSVKKRWDSLDLVTTKRPEPEAEPVPLAPGADLAAARRAGAARSKLFKPKPAEPMPEPPGPAPTPAPPVEKAKTGTKEFEKPKAVEIDPATASIASVLKAADERFAAGEFADSAAQCQAAMSASLNLASTSALARRIERANRARWFLEALVHSVENSPSGASGVIVNDRAGKVTGEARAAMDGKFIVKTVTGDVQLAPEDLSPSAAIALGKRVKLGSEDLLNAAFFTLSTGDAKAIDAALQRASNDANLKPALDSAIAFARGMPEVPEWGFFRSEGKWLSFKERETERNSGLVAAAFDKLDHNEKERAQGLDELKALMPVARAAVVDRLRTRRVKMVQELTTSSDLDGLDKVLAQRQELDKHRAFALELIFDTVKYFYPYKAPECPPDKEKLYAPVQQEVDERVKKVREVWGDEFEEEKGGFSLSSKFRRTFEELLEEEAILVSAEGEGFTRELAMERVYLLPKNATKVTLRNIALTSAERVRLDRDAEVLQYNATATTSAQKQEIEQIWITNMYRLMMGRGALRVHEKLIRAARGHTEYLTRIGRLDHFEDDPKRRTPEMRIALEGYAAGGSGENLALVPGARGAHDAWCHSSGHHRNLLFESHAELGVANAGNFWTQNFAGGGNFTGNQVGE